MSTQPQTAGEQTPQPTLEDLVPETVLWCANDGVEWYFERAGEQALRYHEFRGYFPEIVSREQVDSILETEGVAVKIVTRECLEAARGESDE